MRLTILAEKSPKSRINVRTGAILLVLAAFCLGSADLRLGTTLTIWRDDNPIGTAPASKSRVGTFESMGGGSFEAVAPNGANRQAQGNRFVAMVAPNQGETFTAPATLRLVAAAHDASVYNNYPTSGLGGNAAKEFLAINFTGVATIASDKLDFSIWWTEQ